MEDTAAQRMLHIFSALDTIKEKQKEIIDLLQASDAEVCKSPGILRIEEEEEEEEAQKQSDANLPLDLSETSTYLIFKSFLKKAYNGRIPEHHIIGASKIHSRLDARIVQECWAQTLKAKPIEVNYQRQAWKMATKCFNNIVRRDYWKQNPGIPRTRYKKKIQQQPEDLNTSEKLLLPLDLSETSTYHIFKMYLRKAYGGRIPKHHVVIGVSKILPSLDASIVQACWAQTLKAKPIDVNYQILTWRMVTNRFNTNARYAYRKQNPGIPRMYSRKIMPQQHPDLKTAEKQLLDANLSTPYRRPTYFHGLTFKMYLRKAYNGRIPEHHVIGVSKILPSLDARIVQECWAQTLKAKPLPENIHTMVWQAVKTNFDNYVGKQYRRLLATKTISNSIKRVQ